MNDHQKSFVSYRLALVVFILVLVSIGIFVGLRLFTPKEAAQTVEIQGKTYELKPRKSPGDPALPYEPIIIP